MMQVAQHIREDSGRSFFKYVEWKQLTIHLEK
jgi:hypothetical protein